MCGRVHRGSRYSCLENADRNFDQALNGFRRGLSRGWPWERYISIIKIRIVDARRKLQTAGTRGGNRGENLTTIPDTAKYTGVLVLLRKNTNFALPSFFDLSSPPLSLFSFLFVSFLFDSDRSVFGKKKDRCSIDTSFFFASLSPSREIIGR